MRISPYGDMYRVFEDMLAQSHLLIAGASGSGKSTLLNGLIWEALYKHAGCLKGCCEFFLIDPKRVELARYKNLWHTKARAVSKEEILALLQTVIGYMEARYRDMEKRGLRMYDGGDVYVIIDEYADICDNKKIVESVIKIAQLGRASRIHLWLCTQRPTRDVITGRIKVNMDARVALHCVTAQDSRNILDMNGAEQINVGQALYYAPNLADRVEKNLLLKGAVVKVNVPYITDEELDKRVKHWTDQQVGTMKTVSLPQGDYESPLYNWFAKKLKKKFPILDM